METDFELAFVRLRPALLRHCYRMAGSFAEAEDLVQEVMERAWKARDGYAGGAPLQRWLYTIATNACLNALATRRVRGLPQLESEPVSEGFTLHELEPARWITPAPDARLYPAADGILESRETVALAFIALLQRLPPKQRAAILMKDVLGWAAEDIAAALALSPSSVNSALHRGRQTLARATAPPTTEPKPEALHDFLRAWETRDLHRLVALLRHDVEMAMPPHTVWLRGRDSVERFLQFPRFSAYWSSVVRVVVARANGLPALAFLSKLDDGTEGPHSLMVTRFTDRHVAEMIVFVGPAFLSGFDFSMPTAQLERAGLS